MPTSPDNLTITFCGYTGNNRLSVIEQVKSVHEYHNIVYRSGFWAPEITSKINAKKSFYSNMLSGSFALCLRGNGNFSYRFYEALSFGRIPILINTDCVLPFESKINWKQHVISVSEKEIYLLPKLIQECNISPAANRQLWQTFFSAEGYFNNFIQDL